MTDDSPDTRSDADVDTSGDSTVDTVPGAGAGDAAHTAQIPRIERPLKPGDTPAAGVAPKDSGPQTDKGRPRPTPAKATPAKTAAKAPAKTAPAAKKTSTSAQTKSTKAGPGPTGRPLSAADYARTTTGSPASTSVIPAVKDEPAAPAAAKPASKDAPQPKNPAVRTEPVSDPSPREAAVAGAGRAATLRLSYVDPWSVTRMAFAISVALMIVSVVAAVVFWLVLDVTGVWDQIDGSVTSVLSDDTSTFQITDYLGLGRLIGLSLVISALNVVLFTVVATIGAHLYNLAAQLLGGLHLTFTSHD